MKQSEYGLVSRRASMGRRIERPRHRHGQAGSDGGGTAMAHEGLEQQVLLQGADAVDPIRVAAAAEPGHRRCRSRLGDPLRAASARSLIRPSHLRTQWQTRFPWPPNCLNGTCGLVRETECTRRYAKRITYGHMHGFACRVGKRLFPSYFFFPGA